MKYLKHNFLLLIILGSLISFEIQAQSIQTHTVLKIDELANVLKDDEKAKLQENGKISTAKLAKHFRDVFSERFFYDYKTFYTRLDHYTKLYNNKSSHEKRALDHLSKYPASSQWLLPFNYKNGSPVNAYALRHLARQHKMVDIAFLYFNEGKDPKYIKYFEDQMKSLNLALATGQYEKIKDGNGVYEVFRSGYRITNWLWIHNMFLNEKEYSDEDQLRTIATLLQHGKHLYERNSEFRSGNHQTRGMAALALISIVLQDFVETDKWYDRSMARLGEHLDKEINPDGFQFERSVHYHMSDINNYFYVYQLAKINGIKIDKTWEEKLYNLFTTLVKIAYPDKSAPVLQDDTEIPWGEKNDISGALTLGYLLFENPEFGYFASDKVDNRMYWYLSNSQVELLNNIKSKKPTYGSLAFEKTHYYIMREGWNKKDKMMIISAGLDADKPDHQHGDMLGIQAIANGQIILPNYQVRYSLKDFELFKNSMVKNVALVDDELQGKKWTSNKGGSGFGKFKELPIPKVITWETNKDFDLFVGSHDGFENIGVKYSRQVIFVKDDFWIVKDNFGSESVHEYKQVWQGHYTQELNKNIIRSSFVDATGCDILQLNPIDKIYQSGSRGKNWTVMSKENDSNFDFLTVIYPYSGYNNRIDESSKDITVGEWKVNDSNWNFKGKNPISLDTKDKSYVFGVNELKFNNILIKIENDSDVFLKLKDNKLTIHLLSDKNTSLSVRIGEANKLKGEKIIPGQKMLINLN